MSLDDDFCVAIAHDGTIEGTTQHLDLKTRCYDDALQCARLDELKRDLEFVASPLVPQDTFWLGAGESPRCALEAVALEIFRKHAAASPHAADPKSGVEWWAQVKDPTASQEAAREVCFHWDKDEQAHTLHGMYVFPQLATVTYLSQGGAPTVVLDKRPDSFTGAIVDGSVENAAACAPRVGRHLVFDGRALHAAPRALATSGEGKRYTFLVNVWLGHRPSGIRPFPAAALDKLTRDGASMRFGVTTTPTPDECSRVATLSFPLARSGTRHVVRMRTPMSGHDFVDLGSSAVAYVEVRVDETPAVDRARSTRAAADALDAWHAACARGDGDALEALAADAFVFFGTASEERWARDAFLRYARQRFAKGNTWSYAVVARRCEEVSDGVVAFDEVLDNANLGRCRSTGVIIGGKLAQYNLSLPVPNELILGVVEKIRQTIELLHVDASIVVVNKPRDLLSVPGRHPDAPAPTKKRKRAGEYWEEALARARDEASAGSLAGRLLNGVGSLASIPRREDKFRAHVQRAKGRVGDVDDAAVGTLWRELDDAAKALAAPDAGDEAPNALDLARVAVGDRDLRPVHRLDYETSGVLVFARTTAAASALCAAFRKSTDGDAGDTQKTYLARVAGRLSGRGEWTAAIAPDAAARAKDGKPRYRAAAENEEGAKGARTRWEALESGDETSLLKLEPLTGRSHQLRVHCLAAGHAIVGDPLYASPGGGLCLHAASLALPHPETGERVTFEAGKPFV